MRESILSRLSILLRCYSSQLRVFHSCSVNQTERAKRISNDRETTRPTKRDSRAPSRGKTSDSNSLTTDELTSSQLLQYTARDRRKRKRKSTGMRESILSRLSILLRCYSLQSLGFHSRSVFQTERAKRVGKDRKTTQPTKRGSRHLREGRPPIRTP